MSSPIRIIDTGLAAARWNIAMTAALAALHAAGRIADTVRFHRYSPSVLLGRSQDLPRAADVAYCRRAGIEIARRVTGGGAVFMSPGMLAWDVVVSRDAVAGDLAEATRCICSGVASALSRLGVGARFRAPNDIEIGGRKVSGSSGYFEGRSIVVQGTVLVADETHDMARALGIPEAALRERVCSLSQFLERDISLAEVAAAAGEGLAQALGRRAVADALSTAEIDTARSLLADEIGTEDFLAGRSAPMAEGAA